MTGLEAHFVQALDAFGQYHTAHLWFRGLLGIGGCAVVGGMLLKCWADDGWWPIGPGREGK